MRVPSKKVETVETEEVEKNVGERDRIVTPTSTDLQRFIFSNTLVKHFSRHSE